MSQSITRVIDNLLGKNCLGCDSAQTLQLLGCLASEEKALYCFFCPFHIRAIVSDIPQDVLELGVLEPENPVSAYRR